MPYIKVHYTHIHRYHDGRSVVIGESSKTHKVNSKKEPIELSNFTKIICSGCKDCPYPNTENDCSIVKKATSYEYTSRKRVKYKIVNKDHEGYCSGNDGDDIADDDCEILGYETCILHDDKPYIRDWDIWLREGCTSLSGSMYCRNYGIVMRAQEVVSEPDTDIE